MGRMQRRKGRRAELEIVHLHRNLGIEAERVPDSGASRYRQVAGDVDVHVFGENEGPLIAEVKSRGKGTGFRVLERWLADNDLLFVRRDHAQPLVVLGWDVWERLILRVRR